MKVMILCDYMDEVEVDALELLEVSRFWDEGVWCLVLGSAGRVSSIKGVELGTRAGSGSLSWSIGTSFKYKVGSWDLVELSMLA